MTLSPDHQALGITEKDCWQTPPGLLARVRALAPDNRIWFDPCTEANNPTGANYFMHPGCTYAAEHWPIATNDQLIYQNHPYSINGEWIDRVLWYQEHRQRIANPGQYVVLANASSGTAWFRRITEAADATALLHNRVAFVDPENAEQVHGNQWGTAVWYFGRRANAFQEIWSPIATIMAPRDARHHAAGEPTDDDLTARLANAEPDVRRVLEKILHRLERGRTQYGDLELAVDRRDWAKEIQDEALDMLAYAAMRQLQGER